MPPLSCTTLYTNKRSQLVHSTCGLRTPLARAKSSSGLWTMFQVTEFDNAVHFSSMFCKHSPFCSLKEHFSPLFQILPVPSANTIYHRFFVVVAGAPKKKKIPVLWNILLHNKNSKLVLVLKNSKLFRFYNTWHKCPVFHLVLVATIKCRELDPQV